MKRNPAVWFEIYVDDMDRAKKFYEEVFQVELTAMMAPGNEKLQMLSFPMSEDMDAPGASGALVKMEGFSAGHNSVIVYLGSEDCAVETGRVEAAGGKVQKEKFSIDEYGFISLITDSEGNTIGIHSLK